MMFLLIGCGEKKPTNIGRMINSSGKHQVHGKFFDYIEIKESDLGQLRCWIGTESDGVSLSRVQALTKGWFLFLESESRLWIYYGEGDLNLTEFSEDNSLSGAPYKFSDIPPPVVSSLPADLKKKLKVNEPGRSS